MTDTDVSQEELEQLAEDRVKIEDRIEEHRAHEQKKGEIGTAVCTDFAYTEKLTDKESAREMMFEVNGIKTSSGRVNFEFRLPDGSTTHQRKRIADVDSFESYLESHNATNVTDMLGAKRSAIYTDNGWKLLERNLKDSRFRHYLYAGHGRNESVVVTHLVPVVAILASIIGVLVYIGILPAVLTAFSLFVGYMAFTPEVETVG